MPKTVTPGEITLPSGETFAATAMPDPFDARDYAYRPRLQPLPPSLDQRAGPDERYVMTQQGSSCTGHALASVINAVLAQITATAAGGRSQTLPHVSPYMLYRLARRYDEFPGEGDEGSSLRGALKGWFNHGVLLEEDWPHLDMDDEPDLDRDPWSARAGEHPLGAFYRVDHTRLDDMQSAISELHAVCASAVVHDGWAEPVEREIRGETMHVIERHPGARSRGGHAFAIVGYNHVGFLVQSSWGAAWGRSGFATLPYRDWLESAYDAWVTRPGVPHTPLGDGRTATGGSAGVTAGRPDLRRLAAHVVNLGNDGRLSTRGRFVSSPAQLRGIVEQMGRCHDQWQRTDPTSTRHVLLWAHGGLNSEADGLRAAQESLGWWLDHRIYPIFFAWESGLVETVLHQLADTSRDRLPAGISLDVTEHVDRLVEGLARRRARWLWDEMKENARAASAPAAVTDEREAAGATLLVTHLRDYIAAHGADTVRVHLVGHSAGAIFHAGLLGRLSALDVGVDSLTMLAPALRVDDFSRDVLGHLDRDVRRFSLFTLDDERELDDACGPPGVAVYHKSLLYLVSRALESASGAQRHEVPLLGMERFLSQPVGTGRASLRDEIERRGGLCVVAPSTSPDHARCEAVTHGGFGADPATRASITLGILGGARRDRGVTSRTFGPAA